MKIEWYGQACMVLESIEGTRVLCDPYAPNYGYELLYDEMDFVTVSHAHHDHNYTEGVLGEFEVFDTIVYYNENDLSIRSIKSYHDHKQGLQRGENLIFKIVMDNINFIHAGDLGHVLSSDQVSKLRPCDILALPVGGVFTIDAEEAYQIVKQLKPSLVIPIHYKTPSCKIVINTETDFVNKFLEVKRQKIWEGLRKDLPKHTQVCVLYAQGEKKSAERADF